MKLCESLLSFDIFFFISDPPTIEKTPKNGLIKVFKGDDIFLSCKGNGNPKPKITWTRSVRFFLQENWNKIPCFLELEKSFSSVSANSTRNPSIVQ